MLGVSNGVHPCTGEPGSSNITATVKQPGQQLLTDKDLPARDQQMVRQTQPSDTVANLIPHLPWRWGAQAVSSVWGQAPATLHTSTHSSGAAGSHPGKCRPDLTMLPAGVESGKLSNTEGFQKPWGIATGVAGSV